MADNRYIIDIILNARESSSQAFRNVSKDLKALEQLSDSVNDSIERQEEARKRLADVTTDQARRQRELNREYDNQTEINRRNAAAQLALANATERYAEIERKADENSVRGRARRVLAERELTQARKGLTESIVESKEAEIKAEVQNLQSVKNTKKQIEETERAAEKATQKLERLKEKRETLKTDKALERNKKEIEETVGAIEVATNRILRLRESLAGKVAKAEEVRRQRVRAAVSEEVQALEELSLESAKRTRQDAEQTKALNERLRVQEESIRAVEREAAAYRKSGFNDQKRKKAIEELGDTFEKVYNKSTDGANKFEEAKREALTIRKEDSDSFIQAFSSIQRNLDKAKKEKANAFAALGRGDETAQLTAELNTEKAIREAQAAREYLQSILSNIEANVGLDPSGLISSLPEIEAIKAFLAKDVNFHVEAEVDNASIAKAITLTQGFKGLGMAIKMGMDDAGKGIANFDNLVRGLLTLTIALFFQQILIAVVGLAAGLAALASSAIAAGSALGGALVSGALQALPAIGVLAAFANRVTNIIGAVKQANLLQQQESYKGGQAATKQAKSLDGVVSAQERVKEAQDAITEARKKAREALEDLIISEQRQSLTLEKSQESLQKAIDSGNSFAVESAQLDVADAGNRLKRTRSELGTRQKGGIEGSPEVKDAKKRLTDAQRALAQARQSADQAGSSVNAAAGKLDFLLGNLSKAEKNLYQAILRLQKTWLKFSQTITQPLIVAFTGVVNRVNQILKSSQIVKLGQDISNALADSFKRAFDFLLSDSVISRVANLGREFTRNLKPITDIAISLSSAFLDIAELGAPALAKILEYLSKLATGFADFTGSIRGKTLISEFFDAGTNALIKFSDLLLALGRVIFAVIGRPGSGLGLDAGNKLLDIFIKSLNDLANAINNPDSKIRDFFERFFKYSDDIVLAFSPIIGALAGAIDRIFTKEGIQNVKGFSDFIATVLIPAISQAAYWVARLTTVFVDLTRQFPILKTLASAFLAALIGGGILFRITALVKPIRSVYQYAFAGAGKNSIFKIMAADASNGIGKIRKFADAVVKAATMEDSPQGFSSFFARRTGPGIGGRLGAIDDAAASMTNSSGALIDPVTGRFTTKEKALAKTRKSGFRGTIQKGIQKTPVLGKVAMGAGLAGGAEALAASGGAGSAAGAVGAVLGPVGIILAIVAAITALLAISGKLDDVWRAIKQTFQDVFDSIKEAVGELAKELTGEKSVKKAFDEIVDGVKFAGEVLAAILIPAIKIVGVIFGTVIVTIIKRITAVIRFIGKWIDAIKMIFNGLKNRDFGMVIEGFKKAFTAIKDLIWDLLKAPFEALGGLIEKIFPGIEQVVLGSFERMVNGAIAKLNDFLSIYNSTIGFIADKLGLNIKLKIDPVDFTKNNNKPTTAQEKKTTDDLNKADTSGMSRRIRQQSRDTRQYRREQRQANDRKEAKQPATQADSKNAESFLTSFNPETVKLSGEITKKLSAYWRTLRREARNAANYVTNRLNDIRKDGGKDIDKFVDQASQNFQRLRRSVRSNMIGVANIVRNQMYLAKKAVYDGAVYMKDALNEALDSVGSNSKVKLSLEAPKRDDRGGQGAGRASGGWIGNRGERGRDAVPTMLGRGEAVLNWQQQKVVEPALYKTYGFGLDDMFSRTKGYHAGGPVRDGLARGGRAGGLFRSGLASWFGGANDSMNTGTALGLPDTAPGIALLNQSTLGKYFRVVSPQGRWRKLRQIDIGPAAWTGKILDITSAALKYFGYNERNFPTGRGIWKVYGPVGSGGAAGGGTGGALANIAMPIIKGGTEQMRELVKKSTKKMVDAANRKLEREAPAVPDGGSLDVPKGASGSLRAAMALAQRMGLQITSTTGGGHAPNSWHYRGRAFDAAGPANRMAAFFRAALKRYGRNILELFYDPLGGIKNGQSIGAIGDHMDHVHLALARGGRAIQRFAYGGHIKGAPDGQPVPIIAHSGEWVLNKKQQGMVAAAAGLSPNALKGRLGFTGGPTSFAGGGTVRGFKRDPLTIPPGLLQTFASFGTFDKELTKALTFITRATRDVLSARSLRRQISKAEKTLSRLKKGGEDDKEKKQIEETEKLLKDLRARRDYTTLLSSIRALTGTDGESGALGEYAKKIKKQFDDLTAVAKLAGAGFERVGSTLKKITDPTAFKNAVDPAKLADLEAQAQAGLLDRLVDLRNKYQATLSNLESASKKFPSLSRLASENSRIEKTIEKLDDSEKKSDKERVKKLKKRQKELKDKIKLRQRIDGELNGLRDRILEKENEIIEAEQARLEAEQKAFEERTKQATRDADVSDSWNNFVKSVSELTGDTNGVAGALNQLAVNARTRRDALQKRLDEASKKAKSDPRWQSVVDELQQQVLDANLAVVQTQADIIENSINAIENAFQRSETTRGLAERAASLLEKTGFSNRAFSTRLGISEGRGTSLIDQRDALKKLLDAGNINAKQSQELQDKINELEMAIKENTQETLDLRLQYQQAQLELINERTNTTTGILDAAMSIFENISKLTGTPDTAARIANTQQRGNALQEARGSIIDQILSDLASGSLAGPNGNTDAVNIIQQLLAAFSSGDPASFASTLSSLASQIQNAAFMEGFTPEQRKTFLDLISSMYNNTIAVTDNTAQLNELNGLANQPQDFGTTSWTRFRAAIFNGLGDVLPQFQVPQMATGGYITQGGLFQLHPGEFVVNANQSNVPDAGDINITVNEANKPLDVTALASRIAFEKRTRR